ncbi:MAG: M23 family metallopeptidase [Oscillospiraceae bacterium]|nr:M23 family metallopeptidase [Oscillospiraceae bacterium]
MSNEKFKISSKSLIITSGICVAVAAIAGFYTYNKASDQLNAEIIGNNKTTLSAEADPDTPVNVEQTNIAKTEVTTVTETESAESAIAPEIEVVEEAAAITPQVMVRPLNGEVINAFSGGELVKSKTLNVWKTHDGVDIAGALNEKVKSMAGGTVTKVYEDQLMGACVIIDHGNGLEGYYCNLSKDIPIAEGQNVSAGTIIGMVGDTAESEISEPTHLHFAVKKNDEWIDPIALISGEGS